MRLSHLAAILGALSLIPASVAARNVPNVPVPSVEGPFASATIYGFELKCVSYYDQSVDIYVDYNLEDVGKASTSNGRAYIVLNPAVLGQYSKPVALWWFFHECAHHALGPSNSEVNADCWGIREMRDLGLLDRRYELNNFAAELMGLQGSAMGHLPGPQRVNLIIDCAYS